jgi:hypothetical protein
VWQWQQTATSQIMGRDEPSEWVGVTIISLEKRGKVKDRAGPLASRTRSAAHPAGPAGRRHLLLLDSAMASSADSPPPFSLPSARATATGAAA